MGIGGFLMEKKVLRNMGEQNINNVGHFIEVTLLKELTFGLRSEAEELLVFESDSEVEYFSKLEDTAEYRLRE